MEKTETMERSVMVEWGIDSSKIPKKFIDSLGTDLRLFMLLIKSYKSVQASVFFADPKPALCPRL